jgi:hypothetical protein
MNTSKKIPTDEDCKEIIKNRELDLLERGENHPVYDMNGKIVELKAANIWYDELCKYVKPKSTEEINCIVS